MFALPASSAPDTGFTWPAANVPAARLDTLGVDAVNVETDGTTAAILQARTLLEATPGYPAVNAPSTLNDLVVADIAATTATSSSRT